MLATNKDPRRRTRLLLLGPKLEAVSGVATHLNQLIGSRLVEDFDLSHFQVGSEGQRETAVQKIIRLFASPLELLCRIIRFQPDIVHVNASLDHKSFPRDAVYVAVAKLLGKKVVFQIHGGELPENLYRGKVWRTRAVARILRAADAVVLLAQAEFHAYSAFVPGGQLHVIPNAIELNPTRFSASRADGPLRLVYVGRLVESKGVAVSIAAAGLLMAAGREFTLKIAGAGPEEAALRTLADALGAEGRIEFVGAVFGSEKEELWRSSDIFLFPTGHLEGLPYALLESMAAGTVPITTRMGAHPDVIEDGVQGFFVGSGDPQELFDVIARLDDDRELLASVSQLAQQRIAERYTAERLSSDFSVLFRSVVESRRIPHRLAIMARKRHGG